MRKVMLEGLEKAIREVQQTDPVNASDAQKCLPYIKCFSCLDTERYIGDRAVLTVFGYDAYRIRSCSCTGRVQDYETTRH